jgi:hypothetical protein
MVGGEKGSPIKGPMSTDIIHLPRFSAGYSLHHYLHIIHPLRSSCAITASNPT